MRMMILLQMTSGAVLQVRMMILLQLTRRILLQMTVQILLQLRGMILETSVQVTIVISPWELGALVRHRLQSEAGDKTEKENKRGLR